VLGAQAPGKVGTVLTCAQLLAEAAAQAQVVRDHLQPPRAVVRDRGYRVLTTPTTVSTASFLIATSSVVYLYGVGSRVGSALASCSAGGAVVIRADRRQDARSLR